MHYDVLETFIVLYALCVSSVKDFDLFIYQC
jgi:hypothetical protein